MRTHTELKKLHHPFILNSNYLSWSHFSACLVQYVEFSTLQNHFKQSQQIHFYIEINDIQLTLLLQLTYQITAIYGLCLPTFRPIAYLDHLIVQIKFLNIAQYLNSILLTNWQRCGHHYLHEHLNQCPKMLS